MNTEKMKYVLLKRWVLFLSVFALLCAGLSFVPGNAVDASQRADGDTTKFYKQPFASAARGTTTSSSVESHDGNMVVAWLTVTAKSAGATALDLKLQDSYDNSAFADMPGGSFAQVTSSTSAQRITVQAPPGKWVQVVATVAGSSTPTFTFHCELMFAKLDGGLNLSTAADASTLIGTLNTTRISEDVARTTQVTVPTASVLLLSTTPYTLVPAPGAGKYISIEEIVAKLTFNSVAYTGANALEFRYTDGSGAKVSADIANTFINSASGTSYASVKSVVTALTPVANAAVIVRVPTADPGAGNSAIVFSVKYRVVTP